MSIPTDYADRAFGNSAARLENTYKMGSASERRTVAVAMINLAPGATVNQSVAVANP
jgi:hypothetical protein